MVAHIHAHLDAGQTTQVVSAAAAAFAAIAAWRSVRQGQRLWHAGQVAELQPMVMLNEEQQTTDLAIVNVGGGIAKAAYFMLATSTHKVEHFIGRGFLLPRQGYHVHTDLPLDEAAVAVVAWRTVDESSWGAPDKADPERFRKGRKGSRTSMHEIWARFHPDRPLDGLNAGTFHVEPFF